MNVRREGKTDFPHRLLPLVVAYLTTPEGRRNRSADGAWRLFQNVADRVINEVVAELTRRRRLDRDDARQSVWIQLIHTLPRHEHRPCVGTVSAWVAGVARRTLGKRRGFDDLYCEVRLERVRHPLDFEDSHTRRVNTVETQDEARVLLERLRQRSESEHQVVFASYIEMKSDREVARELGIQPHTVRKRRERGLLKLRGKSCLT